MARQLPKRAGKTLPPFRDPVTGELVTDVDPLVTSVLATQDRLTTVISINHERFKEQPFGKRLVISEMLENKPDDPYYTRRQVFGKEWKLVDLGYIGKLAGTIIVENREGCDLAFQPTDEQKKQIEGSIVELSYSQNSDACDLLKPRGMEVKHPSAKSVLYGRCQNGEAKCRVTVFSR